MINAKEEFLTHTEGKCVKCATFNVGYIHPDVNINLPVGYDQRAYEEFLERLNFNYDNGYGGQELFGCIWYEDGTWSERGEYDGSEWWEHHAAPEIPAELADTVDALAPTKLIE